MTRRNPSGSLPPGFQSAVRLFQGFHQYDVSHAAQFPASVKIPNEVYYGGPVTYMTYRSDKWNDGTHDYIHKIESYPRVAVGFVKAPQIEARSIRRVPARICDNWTVVETRKKAIGFGYRDNDGHEQHVELSNCIWFWHPRGRAFLLIRGRRELVAIIWGGKLAYTPRGIVG